MYQLNLNSWAFCWRRPLHLMKLRSSRSSVGLALKAFLARSRHNKDLSVVQLYAPVSHYNDINLISSVGLYLLNNSNKSAAPRFGHLPIVRARKYVAACT